MMIRFILSFVRYLVVFNLSICLSRCKIYVYVCRHNCCNDNPLYLSPSRSMQVLGRYKLTLNGFNGRALYDNMNNACPAYAPTYMRTPHDC